MVLRYTVNDLYRRLPIDLALGLFSDMLNRGLTKAAVFARVAELVDAPDLKSVDR